MDGNSNDGRIGEGVTEKEMKLKFVYKGGPGSGFAGHQGIPGHQGGSQSGMVYADVKSSKYGKGYLISGGTENLYSISDEFGGGTNDHVGFMAMSETPEDFGLSKVEAKAMLKAYENGDEAIVDYWKKAFISGLIRVREFGNEIAIETMGVNNATLRRMQRLYDKGKLGLKPDSKITWEGMGGNLVINTDMKEFLSTKYVTAEGLKEYVKESQRGRSR
jgi:hypothetical protein